MGYGHKTILFKGVKLGGFYKMYNITREDDEINEVLNKACESEDNGRSQWPGMTYEQGVKAAIDWITGATDDNPMED